MVGEFNDAAARRAKRGEGGDGVGQRSRIPVPDPDGGAGLEKALGDGEADAAHATGDDGGALVEVDLVHRARVSDRLERRATVKKSGAGTPEKSI
ncbi:MAG: hypothetical protein R3F11_06535 [Verrucomicrobiales bacterium]